MAKTSSTMLELGTVAPEFTLPEVLAGQMISSRDFEHKKALLVMFICRHCPYVKHVEQELARLGETTQTAKQRSWRSAVTMRRNIRMMRPPV